MASPDGIRAKPHDPAQEYLILIGAPSNTFNGYYFTNDAGNDQPEPAPADTSGAQIRRYIQGDGSHPAVTHDLYWADFLYSAVKLVENGIVRPQPGDILTFMLYWPGYVLRNTVDWDASPYNDVLHHNSCLFAGKYPYDATVRASEQGKMAPPPHAPIPSRRAPAPPTYSPLEADINHEILMRTTNEDVPLGAYEKRARFQSYHGHIHDIPKRIVLGSAWGSIGNVPPLKRVLVKLLLLTTPDDLYNYLHDGTWLGDRWFHPLDLPDPDQEGVELPPNSGTWDVHAMPLNFHPKDWNQTPSVDRTRVKIKRFDYFGHASGAADETTDAFFLQYGWSQGKGSTVPVAEVLVSSDDLHAHLPSSLFTKKALVKLWGCNLGWHMAPMFQDFADVEACEGWTSYDNILSTPDAMPEPADSTAPWVQYIHP